jgi:hypothetical protein
MRIHLIELPSCMITISGTISRLIGISQWSKNGRILLPHSSMLIGHIRRTSVIQCSTRSLPRLTLLEYLISLACIKIGTQSRWLNSVSVLGEVEMGMGPPSTSALKAIDSVYVSWTSLLSSVWLTMTFLGLRLSLKGP